MYVETARMIADIFTKALTYAAFASHATCLKGVVFPDLKRGKKRGLAAGGVAVADNAKSATRRAIVARMRDDDGKVWDVWGDVDADADM